MRRIIASILCVAVLVFFPLPISACAEEYNTESEIIFYEDGSYAVITISVEFTSNNNTIAKSNVAKSVKSGSKSFSYYDDSGVLKWQATLTASFTYDGDTSSCTSANCTVSTYDSAWVVLSNNSSHSGNTATANVTMGRKVLGAVIGTKSCTISLSCDANGNLS